MNAVSWIQFLVGAAFLIAGLVFYVIQFIGVFRFKYVMNRMHAAGLGDTLGILSVVIAVAVLIGNANAIFKLVLIFVFMCLPGPVVTPLMAQAEVRTHRNSGHEYKEEDRT